MKKVHPLFKNMPTAVQGLRKQAEQEQRQQSRKKFWENLTTPSGFKPLPTSNKV